MSNDELALFADRKDQRYNKIWIAVTNPREFQRLMRFENCEFISVPTICDGITLKLNEEASRLVSNCELRGHKHLGSFFEASQLFIGLIYVHEQQVKFLYDLASQCTLPTRFLIENQNVSNTPIHSSFKKALKRKSSTKERESLKRKISLATDTSNEAEDIETQNNRTMELLRSACVANNADISIHESFDDPRTNEMNEPTYLFEEQFDEVTAPERSDFDDALLMMSTLNQQQSMDDETGVPINMLESTRRPNSEIAFETINGQSRDLEVTNAVGEEFARMDVGPDPIIDSLEMEILEASNVPDISKISSRKRKRRQPFKDVTLIVNVKANMKTASTTQRHSNSKDDSVSKTTCLNKLSMSKIFDKPNHSIFSESMQHQFESRSMSGKLLKSFNRMTLTKTEATNRDMVQEFCTNQLADNPPDLTAPNVEISLADVGIPCQGSELSPQLAEITMDECSSQPHLMTSNDEQISAEIIIEPPNSYQYIPVELSPVIRRILVTNEILNQYTRCDTDSQKLFVSRSRQNKLDWGTEGVLKKLMTHWDSGVYPIGMNEVIQSNNHRISAATAFFSVMELNSAHIGLINIIISPNSNTIFNIIKSPKLEELQQVV